MYTTVALVVGLMGWPHGCTGGCESCGVPIVPGCGHTSLCLEPPDMPPHVPYRPSYHGYYYFRPYHHVHVLRQRDAAGRFGSDPRNPYANEIFEQVYESIEAKNLEKMPAPQQRR